MRPPAISVAAVAIVLACAAPPGVDLDAARASLEAAAAGYHEAAAATDAERVRAYYADDGAMMPPNAPDAVGPAAIAAQVEGFTSLENFQFHAEAPTVVLSSGGTMGYSVAEIHLSWTADGETISERLRDVHVWTREADGTWKLAIDVWNSLDPAAEGEGS